MAREQLNIELKDGEKQKYLDALTQWQNTIGNNGTSREFLLWALDQLQRQGIHEDIARELAEAGIDQIIQVYTNQTRIQEQMIRTIADVVKQSKANAEAEVKAELDQLRNTAKFNENIATRTQEELKKTKAKLEEANTELVRLAEVENQHKAQIQELTDTKAKLETAIATAETAKRDIEIERQAVIDLREQTATYQLHIAQLQKQLNDKELEHQKAYFTLQKEFDELTTVNDHEKIEFQRNLDTCKKLQEEAHHQSEMIQTISRELEETKIKLARAEVSANSKEQEIQNLKAIIEITVKQKPKEIAEQA